MFQLSLVSALDSGGEGLLGVGPGVGGAAVAWYPESALQCGPSRVGGRGDKIGSCSVPMAMRG